MTWIRLESERYPPPAPTADDQPMIDAEYRVIHDPQECGRWGRGPRRAEPRPTPRTDVGATLKAALRAALRASSMLVPFWTIRVLVIILLWPVADLVRMTAVTLACLMIVMRPFIQFFSVASWPFAPCGTSSSGATSSPPGPSPFGPLPSGRSRPSGTSSWGSSRPTWI